MIALHRSRRKLVRDARTIALTTAIAAGCAAPRGGATTFASDRGAGGSTPDGAGDEVTFINAGSGGSTTNTGTDTGHAVPTSFIPADRGAYARGDALAGQEVSDTGPQGADHCTTLVGVVRDFRGADEPFGHPDFESFSGARETPGLVERALGSDGKPVYAGRCDASDRHDCPYGQQMTNEANFNRWYRSDGNDNRPYLLYLQFAEDPETKVATFESQLFFPLDGAGFGDSGTGTDGEPHNFGFTTEIHTRFAYRGGEVFAFTGDDDLWVFVDGKLAIDLGGLHPPASETLDLDEAAPDLGLTRGNVYRLDLFHAERHTEGSTFRVDTNLAFVDCGSVLPDLR